MPEMPLSETELYTLIKELMADTTHDESKSIYTLLGLYHADWIPEDAKQIIIEFLENRDLLGRGIVDDMELGFKHKVEKEMKDLETEWSRESAWSIIMEKKAITDPLNPVYLAEYFENFKNIMKRQMPFATDKELFQDAFTQMIELILPVDKMFDIEYLEKIVALAKTLQPPIEVAIPTNVLMEARRKSVEKQEKEEQEHAVKDKQTRRERGDLTLEEQMEEAIADERYEDAGAIKKKLDMLSRVMGKFDSTLSLHEANAEQETLVVYADNLDLVQPDKSHDSDQPDQTRQRHRKRFRNEPGGSDEVFMEGLDGMKNTDKGIGTDQYQDVGCPSSINLASKKDNLWKNRSDRRKGMGLEPYNVDEIRNKFRKKIPAPNMPNEKMERDPQEEKATTDTWSEFNNMEAR